MLTGCIYLMVGHRELIKPFVFKPKNLIHHKTCCTDKVHKKSVFKCMNNASCSSNRVFLRALRYIMLSSIALQSTLKSLARQGHQWAGVVSQSLQTQTGINPQSFQTDLWQTRGVKTESRKKPNLVKVVLLEVRDSSPATLHGRKLTFM